jgi:hypothetical protein
VSLYSNEVGSLWLQGPLNHLGRKQKADNIEYYSPSSNFRIFSCLSHLVAEVEAFLIVFSLLVCSLCCCYCGLLKPIYRLMTG